MHTAAQTVLLLSPALALRPIAAPPLVGYPYGSLPELPRTAHLSPLTLLTALRHASDTRHSAPNHVIQVNGRTRDQGSFRDPVAREVQHSHGGA